MRSGEEKKYKSGMVEECKSAELGDKTSGNEDVPRLRRFSLLDVNPALAGWAKLCRASGAGLRRLRQRASPRNQRAEEEEGNWWRWA